MILVFVNHGLIELFDEIKNVWAIYTPNNMEKLVKDKRVRWRRIEIVCIKGIFPKNNVNQLLINHTMGYFLIVTLLLPFFLFCYFWRNKNGLPTNWPLIGMLPSLILNTHRIHDFIIDGMAKSDMTFHFKGPWFLNMHLLVTVDPANLNHILSKNFGNYVKGPELNEIIEVLGEGILNTDSTLWNYHRNVAQSFLYHPKFHYSLVNVTRLKMENGLIPVLDHFSNHGIEFDLQDLFLRFMYDNMCSIMMDYDPKSLSPDLPSFPLISAVVDLERAIFSRHIVPTCVWKLLRWLNVGYEKKHKLAWKTIDNFIYKCIERKRSEERRKGATNEKDRNSEVSVDLLTLFMDTEKNQFGQNNDKFLRDTISSFFLAGGGTTSISLSWFFYLLSRNPQVLCNIKAELEVVIGNDENRFLRNFKDLSGNLVYLHAALCETLRLYPSVAFNHKTPLASDILPSGHEVNPSTQIIFNMYSMGRMKSIWGDDCNEFKPERWIDKGGMIKNEPSYKFSVFSAGPRTCLGKQMVFVQMKIVATLIIKNYHIQAIEEHHVPDVSMILRMKHGFKVKVSRLQC